MKTPPEQGSVTGKLFGPGGTPRKYAAPGTMFVGELVRLKTETPLVALGIKT